MENRGSRYLRFLIRNTVWHKIMMLLPVSPEEERRMVELDESIEAVDAGIDYKNDILLQVRECLIMGYKTTFRSQQL